MISYTLEHKFPHRCPITYQIVLNCYLYNFWISIVIQPTVKANTINNLWLFNHRFKIQNYIVRWLRICDPNLLNSESIYLINRGQDMLPLAIWYFTTTLYYLAMVFWTSIIYYHSSHYNFITFRKIIILVSWVTIHNPVAI